jgi:DNA-binding response OmpR family regulator
MNMKNHKLKILIIDDETDLRSTIKEVFEIYGWEVQDAANGQIGFDKMQAETFDFVISDICMPISSGIDFLKLLSEDMKINTTIIMMSAYSDYSEKAIQQLGACKLISKPISINDLVREMEAFKASKVA